MNNHNLKNEEDELSKIYDEEENVYKICNQSKIFNILQDQNLQQQLVLKKFPIYKELLQNQQQTSQFLKKKWLNHIYQKQYEKYDMNFSSKSYIKGLLDPAYLQRKKQEEEKRNIIGEEEPLPVVEKQKKKKVKGSKKEDKSEQKYKQSIKNSEQKLFTKEEEEDTYYYNNNNNINNSLNNNAIQNLNEKFTSQQESLSQIKIEDNNGNYSQNNNSNSNNNKRKLDTSSNTDIIKEEYQNTQQNGEKTETKIEDEDKSASNEMKIEIEDIYDNNNNVKSEQQNRQQNGEVSQNLEQNLNTSQSNINVKTEEGDKLEKQQSESQKIQKTNNIEKQVQKKVKIQNRKQKQEDQQFSKLKKLSEEQLLQFKIYQNMDVHRNLKNQLVEKFEENYYFGDDIKNNNILLDRKHYIQDKEEAKNAIEPEQLSQYQQNKLNQQLIQQGVSGFELRVEIEQKLRKQKRYKEFLKLLYQHHTQFFDFHKRNRKQLKKRCQFAKLQYETLEKKKQKKTEENQKGVLQLIRDNNMEEYLNIIKNTKSKRIQELLQQTDKFLRQLGAKIMIQKGQNGDVQQDEELIFGRKSDDYIDNFIQSNKVYYNLTHTIKEEIVKQPSLLKSGNLKSYQIVGLQWMISLYNNKLNGILADEMGLGKTIQTISLFAYLIEYKKVFGSFLVVVPLSTVSNWSIEFEKWAPEIKVIVYKGSPQTRKDIAKWMKIGNWHVVLTTYEYILKDKATLCKHNWKYIVVDEGHRMKNSRSKFAQILGQQYQSDYRLLLTGTPLQNNLAELWALLNFLLPKIFESCDDFEKWFSMPIAKQIKTEENQELNEEEQLLIINRLHQVLRPFLLRRVKKEVEKELPQKTEQVIKVDMSPWQKLYYDQLESKKQVCQDPVTGKVQYTMLNNLLMQLRKICNHPYLFLNEFDINDDLWRVSGKMELLDRIVPKLLNTGHRMLIFTQMTSVMDIMQYYFQYKGIKYLRLDGSTKSEERGESQRLFNMPNSEFNVFLLSTRAGGLGLNLQSADTVIIFDTDWNPQQDLQAQDRAHRIGSKNEVKVLRLITANSIEEGILSKARYKRELDEIIIQAGMYNQRSSQDERTQKIEYLLQRNKDSENKEDDIPNDEQINEMISRSEEEFDLYQDMDKNRYNEEKKIYKNFNYPTIYKDGEEIPNENWENYRYIEYENIPEWIRDPPQKEKDQKVEIESLPNQRSVRQKKQINYSETMSHVEFMRMIGEYKTKNPTEQQQQNELMENEDHHNKKQNKVYLEEEEEDFKQQQLDLEDLVNFDADKEINEIEKQKQSQIQKEQYDNQDLNLENSQNKKSKKSQKNSQKNQKINKPIHKKKNDDNDIYMSDENEENAVFLDDEDDDDDKNYQKNEDLSIQMNSNFGIMDDSSQEKSNFKNGKNAKKQQNNNGSKNQNSTKFKLTKNSENSTKFRIENYNLDSQNNQQLDDSDQIVMSD